jgi:tripartite-type tricarboxylate transporter receptor subunit TctC
MSESFGQPVIVENRPGANTIIAAQAGAKSAPDGYTFLIATDSTMSINPHVYSKLPYDPEKDFTPVTAMAQAVEVMFVPAELPVKSVQDFIDYAKANPGKVNYGSFGLGSNAHLAAVKMEQATGIRMVHVPYKGGADAIPALQTNQVQLLVTAIGVGMSSLKAGRAKVLAVSGAQRHRLLPDVPTFTEAGFPSFDFRAWFGLVAPAGTPPEIVNRVAEDVAKYVRSPAFAEKFATSYAVDAVGSSPAEFAAFMKADREKYGQIIRTGNIKLDTP